MGWTAFIMLQSIERKDRRLWLLALNALLAIALGFFTFTTDQSLRIIIHGGYWALLVISALYCRALFCVLEPMSPRWAEWRKAPRWPAALILAGTVLLLVHETYGFKILMDEVMLLGTSMSMHFERTALVPMRGHDIVGAFKLLAGQLDKRPLFHPFLLSVLHDFTGYRPENAFVLNTLLTPVLLTLAYFTGKKIAGRSAGAIAVVLLSGLPLLAQNATGGGFELLNLVMLLGTVLLGMHALQQRDGTSLGALCLSGILLAQTRYESILFLLPVIAIVLWVWRLEHRPVLSWPIVCSPYFLIPYALQNKVFSARGSSWELASQPEFNQPFSPSYIPSNLQHALDFFFNTTGEQSNSLVIGLLGFIALPFFALWCVKVLRRLRDESPARAALALFAFGLAAHTMLMMCYFWGRFDDPVIRRLSLPLNLLLVLAIITVAAEFSLRGRNWSILAALAGAGLLTQALPVMARHDYSFEYYVGRETNWRREFIAAHPERDYLVIDSSSITWITHLVSSTPILQAIQHKENIVFSLRNRIFAAIYVFQRFDIDPATGRPVVQRDDDLGPDYQLETVWERRFTQLTVSRISRVASVREGPTAPAARVAAPMEKLTPDEREKIRQLYFQRFIQRLP